MSFTDVLILQTCLATNENRADLTNYVPTYPKITKGFEILAAAALVISWAYHGQYN